MTKSDLVDLTMKLHHKTKKALLVSDDGDEKRAVWMPLSQIEIESEKDGIVKLSCPEWLAKNKKLI